MSDRPETCATCPWWACPRTFFFAWLLACVVAFPDFSFVAAILGYFWGCVCGVHYAREHPARQRPQETP
jgi:hypothetical protein